MIKIKYALMCALRRVKIREALKDNRVKVPNGTAAVMVWMQNALTKIGHRETGKACVLFLERKLLPRLSQKTCMGEIVCCALGFWGGARIRKMQKNGCFHQVF